MDRRTQRYTEKGRGLQGVCRTSESSRTVLYNRAQSERYLAAVYTYSRHAVDGSCSRCYVTAR